MAEIIVVESGHYLKKTLMAELSLHKEHFIKGLVIINADEIDGALKLEMSIKSAKEQDCPMIFYSSKTKEEVKRKNATIAALLSQKGIGFINLPFMVNDLKKLYATLL